jgi:aryl-alcohol dehydrogenase-like predicted oxidoreductase
MVGDLAVERRPLGPSGVGIPRVALGCGSFGGIGSAPENFGEGLTRDGAFAIMDAAWELGIDHFDTADAYGGGASETMVGDWIHERGRRPTITTKTFNPMARGADRGLAPERIARQLRSSLERLRIEHVDLYLAHDFDPMVPLADSFGAFEEAVAAGLVGTYGVSNFTTDQLASALVAGAPRAVQNGFSMLQRGDEADLLPLCAARDVGYLAFSPLAGGWLTGKYRRGEPYPAGSRMTRRPGAYADLVEDRTFDVLERLAAAAHGRGISTAGLALSWLLGEDRVTQAVIGPARVEHFEPLVEALATPLSAAERDELAAEVGL